jgi:molecular chaperone GrpE
MAEEEPGSGMRADAGRADAERADLEDRLRRALADADNARKRCEQRIRDERASERDRVTLRWLSIVDNLERALGHASELSAVPGGAADGAVIDGIRAVRDEAVALLSSLGYGRHDEAGVPFDPQLHEAVSVAPDADTPQGTVVRVLRPGYGDGARQLRPAAVVVASGAR